MEEKKNIFKATWKTLSSKPQIIPLFAMLVVGIMSSWFWGVGWNYLHDPGAGLLIGSWSELGVRLLLGMIAAALTFVPVYKHITQNGAEIWVAYLLAFQNGFFWEAALDAVVSTFVA